MTQRPDKTCAILVDLYGPNIRTTNFVKGIAQSEFKLGPVSTMVADPKG